ncbi:methyltransferase [Spirosoma endbachense]|uniref:Methyltransferase n=1 Tax=Spirosoma endbachense TaxID=2666025 RepID=A0A6P1W796_9BACT|nr:methyltransferase [Spirosoma endbachense]QHV99907.1 methyltransferase [Spirosoma endbachense]
MIYLRKIYKNLGNWVLIPVTKYYLSKERKIKINGLRLVIPSGVFHPTLFSSTKILLGFIERQSIKNLKTLELGAGSGLLSISMARCSALTTASDISKLACDTVKKNAHLNSALIEVIHSDLFENMANRKFDLILINPPYYPKDPKNDTEKAWFCGRNFEYFSKLFSQMTNFLESDGCAIMVLSEDCDIGRINQLAIKGGYSWQKILEKKDKGEWYFLFKLSVLTYERD